ncbi:FGGY family carbohydrate kinase [Actinomycetospora lutea]|uniref:FGGY-family carbohydrate kinase n=1 Tax=Actinomycetospora lutea TaxID=663604 RepID=UPI002366D801|nr:FGGY family carbohydrate kinase [Actinomycetospora lutea]MDD7936902.1 FGGY family carbohydrate kinase [Actinomycetospora lutea]
MRHRLWIGVDLGTSGVRGLAADDTGTVRASAERALRSTRGHGRGVRHEQDPRSWVEASLGVVAEIASGVDPRTVAGLSVDATSGTVVLTDGPGPEAAFLGPGVMYDDDRGAAHAERAQEAGAATWERLGHRIGATWALPTALALLAEHPGGHLRHQVDVVTGALVGRAVPTDAANALKTGYDVVDGRWPTEVLAELGLHPDRLPPVVAPGTPLGGLGPRAAVETGLCTGTPVVAGTTDGCAAQFGAGAVEPGAWNAVVGTTLVLKGVSEVLLRDPSGAVYCHRGPQAGWWLPGGASSTGAGVLGELVDPEHFDDLTASLQDDPPDDLPVVYPLSGRGERFPFAVPEAEGFWLDGDHARPLGELVAARGERAAFAALAEGIAFVERLCFEHVAGLGADVSGPRTITGGATRNPWWNQRRADVLGVALRRPRHDHPALGAALLARAGVDAGGGEPDLVAAAAAMVHAAEEIAPRPDEALERRYARFRNALVDRGWWAP